MTRPRYHFTAPAGNINDPLGVTWSQGRYHLFYQLNPHAPEWSARCHWGQVDSADMVRWEHPRVALAPDDSGPDHGCWSGAVVVADGVPTMLYTSVGAGAMERGRIAVARGDAGFCRWTKDRTGPVVDGPPAGIGVTHFRDPFVWRVGAGWRMVVGAGLADGSGAALLFSSPHLRAWVFDGVLCSRLGTERDPVWTGTVWECPQFFELDDSWVLIVSVWSDEETHHVAHAVGDFDGSEFVPRTWGRFAHGDSPYATTSFTDAEGRRCAISWCRDAGRPGERPWAGALSLPQVVSLRHGDRLVVAPHPDVDSLRAGIVAEVTAAPLNGRPLTTIEVGEQVDVVLTAVLPGADDRLDLAVRDSGDEPLRLALDRGRDTLTVQRPGRPGEPMPMGADPEGRVDLRVLLDGDVVEVFTGAGCAGAVRIAPRRGAARLVVTGCGNGVRIEKLTVHAVQWWFPA